jgi:hypothetical protein
MGVASRPPLLFLKNRKGESMAQAQLFAARKTLVVTENENGEIFVVRDGLTPAQAKTMAARLNNVAIDDDFKATKREQKFEVEFTGKLYTTYNPDEFGTETEASIKREVLHSLKNTDWLGWGIDKDIYTVIVKKVSDKQVPNV